MVTGVESTLESSPEAPTRTDFARLLPTVGTFGGMRAGVQGGESVAAEPSSAAYNLLQVIASGNWPRDAR
jgi:hypothetical protein